jgi:hypothetical protein
MQEEVMNSATIQRYCSYPSVNLRNQPCRKRYCNYPSVNQSNHSTTIIDQSITNHARGTATIHASQQLFFAIECSLPYSMQEGGDAFIHQSTTVTEDLGRTKAAVSFNRLVLTLAGSCSMQ